MTLLYNFGVIHGYLMSIGETLPVRVAETADALLKQLSESSITPQNQAPAESEKPRKKYKKRKPLSPEHLATLRAGRAKYHQQGAESDERQDEGNGSPTADDAGSEVDGTESQL